MPENKEHNTNKPKTVRFITLGCKVNQYESQLIRESFLKNGFEESNGEKLADVYIINTCTVTCHADRESRHLIRSAHRLNPNARIVVTGCYVERDSDVISRIEGVSDIVKNADKDKLPSSLVPRPSSLVNNSISGFKGHTKAFVKIQDGCNNHCSYCKVPLVRGPSRSRPLGDIKKEVSRLLKNGFKEIVLSGICLGQWGRDMGQLELADVLEELEDLDGKFRIRLSSIELKYINNRLLERIATSKKVCKHLHVPVQSGDNYILGRMDRPYTREGYLAFIRKVRSLIPEIGITTDVLVGFPGEDESRFNATLTLIEECTPHRVHIFSYSRREGTKAADFRDFISLGIIKQRVKQLGRLTKRLSYDYRKRFLDKDVEVLIENRVDKTTHLLTGYTDTYLKVLLKGRDSFKGSLKICKVSGVTPDSTIAEPVTVTKKLH